MGSFTFLEIYSDRKRVSLLRIHVAFSVAFTNLSIPIGFSSEGSTGGISYRLVPLYGVVCLVGSHYSHRLQSAPTLERKYSSVCDATRIIRSRNSRVCTMYIHGYVRLDERRIFV